MLERIKMEMARFATVTRDIMLESGEMPPLLLIINGPGKPTIGVVPLDNELERAICAAMLRAMLASGEAEAFILATESWIRKGSFQAGRDGKPLYAVVGQESERSEAIAINATCADGDLHQLLHFSRDAAGRPVFATTADAEVFVPSEQLGLFRGLWGDQAAAVNGA